MEGVEIVAGVEVSVFRALVRFHAAGSTMLFSEICPCGAANGGGSDPFLNRLVCAGGCAEELKTATGKAT